MPRKSTKKPLAVEDLKVATPSLPKSRLRLNKAVEKVVPISEVPAQPIQLPRLRDEIARKAMQLRKDLSPKVDGFGKPVNEPKKVVEYTLKFSDGSVLVSEGESADLLARMVEECTNICLTQRLVVYNGPGMKAYTAQEWAVRTQGA